MTLPDLHPIVFMCIPSEHMHFCTPPDVRFPHLHTFVFEIPNWDQVMIIVSQPQCPFCPLNIRPLNMEPVRSGLENFYP